MVLNGGRGMRLRCRADARAWTFAQGRQAEWWEHTADVGWRGPIFAKRSQFAGVVPLRQSSSLFVSDQWMVSVDGRRQAKKYLKESMYGREFEQVFASRNVRHALFRIIDDDSQMIACGDVLSCQHDVSDLRGQPVTVDLDPPRTSVRRMSDFLKNERRLADAFQRGPHVETQRGRSPCGGRAAQARIAGSWIYLCTIVPMGRVQGVLDLAPRARAWIDKPVLSQLLQCASINPESLGLTQNGLFPSDAEPAKIIQKTGLVAWLCAGDVQILDSQKETAVRTTRTLPRE